MPFQTCDICDGECTEYTGERCEVCGKMTCVRCRTYNSTVGLVCKTCEKHASYFTDEIKGMNNYADRQIAKMLAQWANRAWPADEEMISVEWSSGAWLNIVDEEEEDIDDIVAEIKETLAEIKAIEAEIEEFERTKAETESKLELENSLSDATDDAIRKYVRHRAERFTTMPSVDDVVECYVVAATLEDMQNRFESFFEGINN